MTETTSGNIEIIEEVVPVSSRVWISGADAATAILQSLVTAGALTYYFTELRGLSLQLTGIVWLIFGIWNAINDPLFGYISDRTKTKIGRRIPYIRYGAPIFIIGYILFWIVIPNSDHNQTTLFLQMLFALFVFDTLYTAIATSLYIMPYEVAITNKARSSIYIWKIIFMVFTLVVPLAIEQTIKPDVGDTTGIYSFRIIMVLIGVVLGTIIFFSTFFYKERYNYQAQSFDFIQSFKECFRNSSFLIFEVISFTIIFVQTALMQGIWVYFDEIDVPPTPLYIALAIGIVTGIFLWINRRDRWGIKLCTQLFSIAFALGCFLMVIFGRNTHFATFSFFLFGIGFSGGMYLIPLMNGDVVDMDEHRTGLRREGMYAGVNSFITKPAISIAQWVLLTFLATYGYDPALEKGLQSYSAETGILMGWTLVPGILLSISFIVLKWYPLSGMAWEEIKSALVKKHHAEAIKWLRGIAPSDEMT
jgi:glycoside/pentoside/hexuronide:cation symporter, GPH family